MKSFYGNTYKCLVDMDGVLVNWLDGICKYADTENPYDEDINWGIGRFCNAYGCTISKTQLYEIMDNYDFWAELEPLPFFRSVIDTCNELFGSENVSILTKPSKSSNSLHGKFDWIKKHTPEFLDRFIFAIDKSFCANTTHILIDDMEPNYHKFLADGGMAYLFPTLQNQRYNHYNTFIKGNIDISEWFRDEIVNTIKGFEVENN